MHYYRSFGLAIASEFELDHLEQCSRHEADLRIRGTDLSEQCRTHALEGSDRAFIATDSGVVMHWRGVGTVAVQGGDRIDVDFEPSVSRETRTLALTGPPMGVLLEQRGRLVLHASAVVVESMAVGFLGHKGFGKSTTAAALSEAGYPVLTDDILAIDCAGDNLGVTPGMPLLKLWPASAHAIYGNAGNGEGEPAADKQLRPTMVDQDGSFSLGALFVLDIGDVGAELISGKQAFLDVLRNSYAGRFVGTDGTSPEHFMRCSRVASTVPMYTLRRRPNLGCLPEVVDVVVDTVRSL